MFFRSLSDGYVSAQRAINVSGSALTMLTNRMALPVLHYSLRLVAQRAQGRVHLTSPSSCTTANKRV
jgi:hypothetical protein